MLKLIGSKPLYMWQTDRQIYVEDDSVKWVDFAHDTDTKALRVEVKEAEEMPVADIPNILLQSVNRIRVWMVGEHGNTICGDVLNPLWRNQPPDYVYTETEIRSYEDLAERISQLSEDIADLKENGSGGGASLDVQINGTSIVENGIATIPMASKDSFGVSKMFPTNDKDVPGVGISGNGVLGIVQATNANIDAKATIKPITPSNLDYAVKAGMTTNALEWTEEEKQAARERIGAVDSGIEITSGEPSKGSTVLTVDPNAEEVNLYTAEEIDEMLQNLPSGGSGSNEKWELIVEHTVEQKANTLLFTEDVNGNPFNLKKLFVYVKMMANTEDEATSNAYLKINTDSTISRGDQNAFGHIFATCPKSTEEYCKAYVILEKVGDIVAITESRKSSNHTTVKDNLVNSHDYSNSAFLHKDENGFHKKIDQINLLSHSNRIGVGSTIVAYGIRESEG